MLKKCSIEDCDNIAENEYCASHAHAFRKAERQQQKDARKRIKQIEKQKTKPKKEFNPISKVSGKMAILLSRYTKRRAEWIRGKFCEVREKCAGLPAVECHHRMGKTGYADEESRMKDIHLLNDERYWLPACSDCHRFITDNSGLALEKGYSLPRA